MTIAFGALPEAEPLQAATQPAVVEPQPVDYEQIVARERRTTDSCSKKSAGASKRAKRSCDNPSLASAELQAVIEEVAEATGIELGQRNMSAARQKDEFFNEITMSLGFECTPGQLVAFLEQLWGSEKLLAVRSIQIAPLSVVDEVSEGMELLKDVRVNLTVGAVLASPPAGEPAEG